MSNSAAKLANIVAHADEVLATATTVFPFTLFPDTVSIDREKVTIVHRTFVKVNEVMSIHIEDILNITANVGPFFGSLEMFTRFFNSEKPYRINYFWRDDALKLKAIIQGYIIARQKKIDTDSIEVHELTDMLTKLGQGSSDEVGNE